MKRRGGNKLTDEQKAFVVQRLAGWDTPTEAAEALKVEHGVAITPQTAEAYDPTKRAGRKLSAKWRELFETTRKNFLDHIETHVPESNKAVRVMHLARAARAYKVNRNYIAMADMLERIAKEMGNVHTNRRELTGKDGQPIQFQDMSIEQVDRELAQMCEEAGIKGLPDVVH